MFIADAYGNPISNAGLGFGTQAANGASATIGTGSNDASGNFTISVTANGIGGPYTVQVSILNTNFSTSFKLTNIAPLTVALTTTLPSGPFSFGVVAPLTATVSRGDAPAGDVTFYDGSTSLGTGTLNGGVATFTTAVLGVGAHSFTAAYSGATSSVLSVTIGKADQILSFDSNATTTGIAGACISTPAVTNNNNVLLPVLSLDSTSTGCTLDKTGVSFTPSAPASSTPISQATAISMPPNRFSLRSRSVRRHQAFRSARHHRQPTPLMVTA